MSGLDKHFNYSGNRKISKGNIPETTTHLTFSGGFNQPLTPGVIPGSVTHLDFGHSFNQPLTPGVIPGAVTHLTIGEYFDQPLFPVSIPPSVTHLTLGEYFTKLSADDIPSTVTHLTLGKGIDYPLSNGDIPQTVTHVTFDDDYNEPLPDDILGKIIYPESLSVMHPIRKTWNEFVNMSRDPSVDISFKISALRDLYVRGYPIPVEPHESSMLNSEGVDKNILRYFSLDRTQHESCHRVFSKRLQYLIYQWIYNKKYGDFNSFITSLNTSETGKVFDDKYFLGEYSSAKEAYEDMRRTIMTVPRTDHLIFAWRGMHGMDDLCMSAIKGTYVGFSRIMACSVAQEVSCNFARDGVMLLIELPVNTPLLNLTCVKGTEPEFLLPDRTVFKVVNRIPYKNFCKGIECTELVHLRLVGIYEKDHTGFEMYLDKESPEEIRIDMVY